MAAQHSNSEEEEEEQMPDFGNHPQLFMPRYVKYFSTIRTRIRKALHDPQLRIRCGNSASFLGPHALKYGVFSYWMYNQQTVKEALEQLIKRKVFIDSCNEDKNLKKLILFIGKAENIIVVKAKIVIGVAGVAIINEKIIEYDEDEDDAFDDHYGHMPTDPARGKQGGRKTKDGRHNKNKRKWDKDQAKAAEEEERKKQEKQRINRRRGRSIVRRRARSIVRRAQNEDHDNNNNDNSESADGDNNNNDEEKQENGDVDMENDENHNEHSEGGGESEDGDSVEMDNNENNNENENVDPDNPCPNHYIMTLPTPQAQRKQKIGKFYRNERVFVFKQKGKVWKGLIGAVNGYSRRKYQIMLNSTAQRSIVPKGVRGCAEWDRENYDWKWDLIKLEARKETNAMTWESLLLPEGQSFEDFMNNPDGNPTVGSQD